MGAREEWLWWALGKSELCGRSGGVGSGGRSGGVGLVGAREEWALVGARRRGSGGR